MPADPTLPSRPAGPESEPAPELPALLHVQDELAGVCAAIAEFWGFTRTQGRIYGLLLMSPEPLDHGTIRTRLEISAGSASMTLASLHEWGVVRRDGRHYSAETDFWKLIRTVLDRRERPQVEDAIQRVQAALAALQAVPDEPRIRVVRARLAYIDNFFRLGRTLLAALLTRGPVHGILGGLARRAVDKFPAAPGQSQ